jgi:3-oxoacyl-ACP reductase-like protein
MMSFLQKVKALVGWKWIGVAAGALVLVAIRLAHNWQRSVEAERRGAERAAEVKREKAIAEAAAAKSQQQAADAMRKAEAASRAAEQHKRKADAAASSAAVAEAAKDAILAEADRHDTGESINDWAKRLGY